jgi:membrane associated rhomboid family serine protease
MGIYDRDYYRRDGPSYLGSFLERGVICKWLIGINIVVFVLQLLTKAAGGDVTSGFVTEWLDLNVSAVCHGQVWRLLSYTFLHAGPLHILFNMLFLWWFGTDVEELYGPREFLAFYLLGGLAGGLLYTLTSLPAFFAGVTVNGAIGASGAVTAVMVLCAIHYPTKIIYLFFVLPIPLWLFVLGSVALDAYMMFGRVHTPVAVACHIGGALFAFTYYKAGIRLMNFLPTTRNWRQERSSPRLRVYHEDEEEHVHKPQPVSVAAPSTPSSLLDDEQLEAKMDAVLEKISRVGKDNLTESEKEVLLRASERLKKRRS